MEDKHKKTVQKALIIYRGLTKKQQNKLYKDYELLINNTFKIELKRINSILSTGYYRYYTWQYKTLKKQQTRIINKCDLSNFVIENGYKYMNL